MPDIVNDVETSVDKALERLGKRIVMAAPLGLGKPVQLINAFYRRACKDSSIQLEILTALSLERPKAHGELENELLEPFVERQYGDYPELEYVAAVRSNSLPANITVHEFYMKAGAMHKVRTAQCNYISTNYTFAARDLLLRGTNLLVQMVARQEVNGEDCLSLSCNTDVTLDLLPAMRDAATAENPVMAIAVTHEELPFMGNRAQVPLDYFDQLVVNPAYSTRLFPAPNMAVSATDFAIGLHASSLVEDGSTLQIGIGAMGDAISYALILRQQNNSVYRQVLDELSGPAMEGLPEPVEFTTGLYGCSEMFVFGFMHLLQHGVLKRKVYDHELIQRYVNEHGDSGQVSPGLLKALRDGGAICERLSQRDLRFLQYWGVLREDVRWLDDKLVFEGGETGTDLNDDAVLQALEQHVLGDGLRHGRFLHGGFFLGPAEFYQQLRDLDEPTRAGIAMDSVRVINRLSDPALQSLQRQKARFINTGMMVTLGGAVVSDGLANGQVVSGVGGQYNFVAQAHELPGARSILCIRSTRDSGGKTISNIVTDYGHITIPRHLRDIVVTEYGIADLRGLSDAEIIKALLNITDSRFQEELRRAAVDSGKLEAEYRVPENYRHNRPERVSDLIAQWQQQSFFPDYPLGCDFTPEEQALIKSLKELKKLQEDTGQLVLHAIRSLVHDVDIDEARPYLERIGLEHPDTPKEKLTQLLLLLELEEQGYLRAH